ncbi:intracellular adhesion protein IcaD [Staphylococcus aureus]
MVRETALIAISCVFWIFVQLFYSFIGTIFEIHDESINTIRVALNIENTEILDIFETMAFSRLSFLVFTISILIQKWQRGRESWKYRKLIILVLIS